MPLVKAPILSDGQPQAAACFQSEIERLDCSRLKTCEADRWQHALFSQQFARGCGFGNALFSQVNIPPTSEAIGQIPFALAVANKD